MTKESFLIYKSFYEPLKLLSTEHKGLLLSAIFEYQINHIEIDLPSECKMAFQFFKNQFRLDEIKYTEIVKTRREIGRQGGLAKASKSTKSYQKLPKVSKAAYNVNENDNVNDKENDLKENNNNIIIKEKKIKDIWTEEEISAFEKNINKKLEQTGLKDFDRKFCQDILNKLNQYGKEMLITDKQLIMLETVFS